MFTIRGAERQSEEEQEEEEDGGGRGEEEQEEEEEGGRPKCNSFSHASVIQSQCGCADDASVLTRIN